MKAGGPAGRRRPARKKVELNISDGGGGGGSPWLDAAATADAALGAAMVGGRAGALLADDGDGNAGGGGKSVFLADLNSVMQKRQLKRAPTHKFGDEATDAAEAAEATDTVDVTKQLSTGSSQKEKSRAPAMSESYASA